MKYDGRMIPTDAEHQASGWVDVLKERYQIVRNLLAECGDDIVVLDSCCGTGWATRNYVSDLAKRAVGFDISEDAIRYYEYTKNNLSLLVMDARKIGFADNMFDVAVALESIEHLNREDGETYIRELLRVLKPDGVLVGSTPLCIHEGLRPWFEQLNHTHLHIYTRSTIGRLLKRYFENVIIVNVFNKVGPYYVFLCSNKRRHLTGWKLKKICRKSCMHDTVKRTTKAEKFYQWAVKLSSENRLSCLMLSLRAIVHHPICYEYWRYAAVCLLSDRTASWIRQFKRRVFPRKPSF